MRGNSNSLNAKVISLSGILTALTVLILFIISIVPTNKLSLYALSSFFIAVIVIEAGPKAAWAYYIACCVLSLVVVPDKFTVIAYMVFFGTYGLLKFYVEKLNKIIFEYIIKFLYFNAILFVSLLFIKEIFFDKVKFDLSKFSLPLWLIIVGLEILFFVYDYVYTLFVQYYKAKIKKVLRF